MLDLHFRFARGDCCLQIDAHIDAPITGILGESGSGKSTLLSVIAGLLTPQQGTVLLNQRVLSNSETHEWVPPHRRRIGLVFQDAQLLPHLSVRQNLLYGYHNILPSERLFELDAIANLFEIDHLLKRKPHSLSGGEKQRVALGRAVLYSPSLMLLDEPLSALDDRLKNHILPFLLRIQSDCNIPMIYVTHSPSELAQLTDTQYRLRDGLLTNA